MFEGIGFLAILAVSNLSVLLGTWFAGYQERKDLKRDLQDRITWLVNDNADLRSQVRTLNRLLNIPDGSSSGININLSQEAVTGSRSNPLYQTINPKPPAGQP